MAIIAITTRPPVTASSSSSRSSSVAVVISRSIVSERTHPIAPWLNAVAATVKRFTGDTQIGLFVMAITRRAVALLPIGDNEMKSPSAMDQGTNGQ